MSELYGKHQRDSQQMFDSVRLADRVRDLIVVRELGSDHKAFIESRDMFFLSTVDHRGFPT